MSAPYLLLVDDNQDDVLLTLRTLRVNRCPLIARVVYDGVQALEYLQKAGALPVAVLLNPLLPGIEVEELIHLLRVDKRTQAVPVLLCAGPEDECHRPATGAEQWLRADACLSKPLNWMELSRVLHQLGILEETRAAVSESAGFASARRLF